MKTPLFFLLLVFSLQTSAQLDIKEIVQYQKYELVYFVDSMSRQEIYHRGQAEIVKMFVNSDATVKMNDTENTHLFARGNFPVSSYMRADFDLDFEVKEGRFRIVIEPSEFSWNIAGAENQRISTFCAKHQGKKWQNICSKVPENVFYIMQAVVDAVENKSDSW